MAISIKYSTRFLISTADLLKGRQKRIHSNPNTPTWIHLSKYILWSQSSTLGNLFPGMHIKKSTIKNQAMPGQNFLKLIFCTVTF